MASLDAPMILAVDDEPDALRGVLQLGLRDRARFVVAHPRDVQLGDLQAADLVLVDYVLSDWAERDQASLAMRPGSGLALAVLLRDHVDRSNPERPIAFALHSAHLDQVRGRLPASAGDHLVARLNNLEWAFAKTNGARWEQMVILADAVRRLPKNWPSGDDVASEEEALKLLGLSDGARWFDRARRNVLGCQPPIHELSGAAHGILFLRWMLHQVLPYPGFLWQEQWVAARLRMSVGSLRNVLSAGGNLAEDLQAMRYSGTLAGFLGPRWWRGALEDYVWELTNGQAADVSTLHAALRERTSVAFDALEAGASVVCLNDSLLVSDEIVPPEKAVRLLPDQWPAFAEKAWTSVALAKDSALLAAVVDPIDAARLDDSEGAQG